MRCYQCYRDQVDLLADGEQLNNVNQYKDGQSSNTEVLNDLILSCIVLCKMFSRWFFANKKLIMMIGTLKFGDVTYNVMS